MPGSPVRIGPFVGGMNTYSGPSAISDDEAVELRNLDVDLDGSLVSRQFLTTTNTAPKTTISRIIGTYAATDGSVYIIFAFSGGGCYALKTGTFAWTTIDATGEYTSCVQYNSKLWLVKKPAGTAVGGSQWDPTGGLVAVATMPTGIACVVYKERMFIASSVNNNDTSMNRLKFSNPANPAAWTGTDTLDVRAGDGQDITALWVFDNNIVVFKTNSTYVYSYESQPSKGQVQVVNGAIGCNNGASVCEYENSLFIMHKSSVFRVSNWIWEQANVKVPFIYANSNSLVAPYVSSVSVLGNRIICRYYDNYYVLGTKTGAWTIWDWYTNSRFPDSFVRDPFVDPSTGFETYYCGNMRASVAYWFKYVDGNQANGSAESFTVRLVTKAYDFGVPYGFKRLYWWGADILAKALTTYKVTPIAYNTPITWGQLATKTFNDYQTWGRPLDISLDVTDSVAGANPAYYRTFVKLLKGLRFRQAQFTLESTSDGSGVTGPFRVFSLTSYVDNKELVSKKVS